MGESSRKKETLKQFIIERDELFQNLTLQTATAYWRKRCLPPPVGPDVPLATAHKARLHWLGATDAMLHESRQWLLENGYKVTLRGAEPLTPVTRDEQRKRLGMQPINPENNDA